ncbi:MAG: heme o synthase [Gammaproteobacteria bacterium]|nr:heme o synthase [Gammaproteobacteria bacterium]
MTCRLLGHWRDYLAVCKLRVVAMMLVTMAVGMVLAATSMPSLVVIVSSLVGVGACASSAAAVNHWLDRHLDAKMSRTRHRPVVEGRLNGVQVLFFALCLGIIGFLLLYCVVNPLTAWLTLLTLFGYAGIYTGYLKRATSQNIVIGGLAGAAPPLLGWTAVTGAFDPAALLLVLIIFTWTPPHFWALAIYRFEDYQKLTIPMLPVVYGIDLTKRMIVLYSILLGVVSELPFLVGMSHLFYAVGAGVLGARFIWDAWRLMGTSDRLEARRLFYYSIWYLLALFIVMLVDHIGARYVGVI